MMEEELIEGQMKMNNMIVLILLYIFIGCNGVSTTENIGSIKTDTLIKKVDTTILTSEVNSVENFCCPDSTVNSKTFFRRP